MSTVAAAQNVSDGTSHNPFGLFVSVILKVIIIYYCSGINARTPLRQLNDTQILSSSGSADVAQKPNTESKSAESRKDEVSMFSVSITGVVIVSNSQVFFNLFMTCFNVANNMMPEHAIAKTINFSLFFAVHTILFSFFRLNLPLVLEAALWESFTSSMVLIGMSFLAIPVASHRSGYQRNLCTTCLHFVFKLYHCCLYGYRADFEEIPIERGSVEFSIQRSLQHYESFRLASSSFVLICLLSSFS